jgi:lipopolysaccharide transport system permease protein
MVKDKSSVIPVKQWSEVIHPSNSIFDLRLKEVWNYRDLLVMFVKRDFIATYKQTILGPVWFLIQPLLTTLMFTIVFGKFARINTGEQPKFLFFLAGITIWNYFSDTFTKTSGVFATNASIFGKVYFPRLIMPLAIIASGMIRFGVQFLLFIGFFLFFLFRSESQVYPNEYALVTPFLILIMAGFSLGAGMIISALTTKYRDFTYLISFGVTLLMYASPVIYPIESLPLQYQKIMMLNPFSSIIETFRYGWLGAGSFSLGSLIYSSSVMCILLFTGVLVFNRVEKSFMDTV